jgi:hypothetical protein
VLLFLKQSSNYLFGRYDTTLLASDRATTSPHAGGSIDSTSAAQLPYETIDRASDTRLSRQFSVSITLDNKQKNEINGGV